MDTLFAVTGLYAAIMALLYVFLSGRIRPLRYKHSAGIGDGGSDELARAIRVHGNFAEYAPFALLLLALGEANGAPAWIIHALGIALVISRSGHAFALTRSVRGTKLRVASMATTFAVLTLAAVVLLWRFAVSLA